ncbi:hypothetical protein Zmor_005914 [Zophobas morio]|uniref:CCHC-type domain-containing protein n=1 Tax=Zophobas morio TaxID=2755281 RepID=A0AA38ML04_9CUCU|nr:hypothetical protein Zmor_005914 [Zophobas morio]
MLKRIKDPNETMATYYYNKMELLQVCRISGKDAVSCVIDGLANESLQNGTRAGRYDSPEALYEEYLSRVQNETDESKRDKHKMHWLRKESRVDRNGYFRGESPQTSGSDLKSTKELRCYNCHGVGHMAAKCPKPKIECKRCTRLGHTAETCTKSTKGKEVLTTQSDKCGQRVYFVDCKMNGCPTWGYVDSGSSAITVQARTADEDKIVFLPPTFFGFLIELLTHANDVTAVVNSGKAFFNRSGVI